MSGPAPKNPKIRQRRNKTKTAAKIATAGKSGLNIPLLEDRPCYDCAREVAKAEKAQPKRRGPRKKQKVTPKANKKCEACGGKGALPWHPYTIRAWHDMWTDPIAKEFIPSVDMSILMLWVTKLDEIKWSAAHPHKDDVREFRLLCKEIGFTPMARRSLQWEKETDATDTEQAADVDNDDAEVAEDDPRNLLRFPKEATS